MKKTFLLTLLLGLLAPALHAQTYSINWYVVAGGGGTSSGTSGGTVYSLSGTIGQPGAGGPLTGGTYSLTGGFWSYVSVVQTVNAPVLTIAHTGGSVIVSWPASATSFTLQQNSNLATTNTWITSSYTITTASGTNSITITPPSGHLYFRLVAP